MDSRALALLIDELLQVSAFRDYAPNGCQVWGHRPIHHLVCGVTASAELIEAAIAADADGLLVHHGYFWLKEPRTLVGYRYRRIARLMHAGLSLLAYHLPLDAHPSLGNNAQLAALFGWEEEGRFGDQGLGCYGRCAPTTLTHLQADIARVLDRVPLCCAGDPDRLITRVAWCTGGAQSFFEEAIDHGVDVFVTGEASEPQYHLARETGVAFIAAGHHATERYGVQALGQYLSTHYDIRCSYVDLPNPI